MSLSFLSVCNDAVALFLCWLLLLAGWHKLQAANRDYYFSVIKGYGIDNSSLANYLNRLLGCAELIIALGVAIPASRTTGAGFAAVLLLAYLLLMARQLLRGKLDLDCGCAGPASYAKVSPALLFRNAGLIALAIFCLTTAINNALISASLGLALPTALGMILLYLCLEQLISNQQKLLKLRHQHAG